MESICCLVYLARACKSYLLSTRTREERFPSESKKQCQKLFMLHLFINQTQTLSLPDSQSSSRFQPKLQRYPARMINQPISRPKATERSQGIKLPCFDKTLPYHPPLHRSSPSLLTTLSPKDQTCTALPLRPLASSTPNPNTIRYKSRIHTHCSLRPNHLTLFAASPAPNLLEGNVCAAPMLLSFTTSF